MLDQLKKRLVQVKGAAVATAFAAAPLIEAKLRRDATTRRGNVPSYGDKGDVPIAAEVRSQAILVTAPDWCLEKADKRGQVDGWTEIVQGQARRILGGDTR